MSLNSSSHSHRGPQHPLPPSWSSPLSWSCMGGKWSLSCYEFSNHLMSRKQHLTSPLPILPLLHSSFFYPKIFSEPWNSGFLTSETQLLQSHHVKPCQEEKKSHISLLLPKCLLYKTGILEILMLKYIFTFWNSPSSPLFFLDKTEAVSYRFIFFYN